MADRKSRSFGLNGLFTLYSARAYALQPYVSCRMRTLLDELNPLCELEVDGGIDLHNIDDVVRAGANVILAGLAVYNTRGTPAEESPDSASSGM